MISEDKIRQKMAAVLDKQLSIVEFARWVMSKSWNMHVDSSENAVSLAAEIHALLSERSDYSLDDAAFLRELRTLYDNGVVQVLVTWSPQALYALEPEPATQLPGVPIKIDIPQRTFLVKYKPSTASAFSFKSIPAISL